MNDDTSHEWEVDNIPNRLTIFRICLIPVIITPLYLIKLEVIWALPYHKLLAYIAGWTFAAASITDFFDGYIARKFKITTVFGSFLDPVADKFLVITSLIILQGMQRIPDFVAIILILREFYITSLRLLAQEKKLKLPESWIAKWKTAFQMVGIPFLMAYDYPWGIPMPLIGSACIYMACLLSLYSALEYSIKFLKNLKFVRKKKGASQ